MGVSIESPYDISQQTVWSRCPKKLTARAVGAAHLLVAGVIAVDGVVGRCARRVASTAGLGAGLAETTVTLGRAVAISSTVAADGAEHIADRHQLAGSVRLRLSHGLRGGGQDGQGGRRLEMHCDDVYHKVENQKMVYRYEWIVR